MSILKVGDIKHESFTGTTQLKLDSAGRLLVGTTTEGASGADQLTVASSSHGGVTIRSGSTSNGNLMFSDGTSGAAEYAGFVQYEHDNNKLNIGANGSTRLSIDSSGTIQVKGDGGNNNKIYGYDGANLAWILGSNNSDDPEFTNFRSGNLLLKTNGSERMRIDSSGRVMIGTTSASGISSSGDDIIIGSIGDSTSRGITFATTADATIRWADAGDNAMGRIQYVNSTDIMSFHTSNAQRLTIDATGDIGVGVAAPDGRFHIMGGNLGGAGSVTANTDANLLVLESNTSQGMSLLNASDERANIRFGTIGTGGHNEASISYAHELVSTTADRRRMFFRTGGNGLRMSIGNSGSHAQIFMNCTEDFNDAVLSLQQNGSCGIGLKAGATNNQAMLAFRNPNGEVGGIDTSGSSTSYHTSSDYRLKENAVAISDGITRLKTLKPYKFNFKADASTTVDGFFAHEVTAVPEAIKGTKDEVDSDNNPVYQGIDQSKLVPLLTAALQEAIVRIEALEAG